MSDLSRTLSQLFPYVLGGAAFLLSASPSVFTAPSVRLLSAFIVVILCLYLLFLAAVRNIAFTELFPPSTIAFSVLLFGLFSYAAFYDLSHYSAVMGFAVEIGSIFSLVMCLVATVAGYCIVRMGLSLQPALIGIFSGAIFFTCVAVVERFLIDTPQVFIDPLVTSFGLVCALALGVAFVRPALFSDFFHSSVFASIAVVAAFVLSSFISTSLLSANAIRPSGAATAHVVAQVYTHEENAISAILFGTGPYGFERAWNWFRPLPVNRSEMWDTDFMTGNGLMMTLLVTSGSLAVLMLYLCVGGMTYSIARMMQSDRSGIASEVWCAVVSVWTFLFVAWITMPPLGAVLLVFIMVGGCAGWMRPEAHFQQEKDHHVLLPYLLTSLLLLACGAAIVTRSAAVSLYSDAIRIASNLNSTTDARALLEQSIRWSDTSEAYLALARLDLHQIRILIEEGGDEPEIIKEKIASLFAHAQTSAQHPLLIHGRNDLRYLIEIGNVLFIGAQLGLHNDVEPIASYYLEARSLAPLHPLPYFLLARLAIEQSDYVKARSSLSQALELRPNFEDALELMQRLPERRSLQ